MATPSKSADEAAVHAVLESMARAVRTRNVDAMLAQCAPEVVTFDLVAPIKHEGADTLRQLWGKTLAAFEGQLDYDYQQLAIQVDGDVAFARSLNRFGGTTTDGTPVVNWLRSTLGLRRIDGRWKIVHQHVSVPFDMESGKALLELHP
jgi:ketosteroid isomerase-like protein